MLFSSLNRIGFTTVLASLLGGLFTLPVSATAHKNQIIHQNETSPSKKTNEIIHQLAMLEKKANGRLGAVLIDTSDHSTLTYRANERFPLCSTSKLMAVSAILKKSETDAHLLNQRVHYQSADLVEYSPVTEKHLKEGMTLAELSAATLQYSDNTAMNLLVNQLNGPDGVTKFARTIGDHYFRLDRQEPELNNVVPGDERDTSTPQAMAKSLSHLVLGNALATAQREQLAEWLKGNTTGRASIQAGVPKGWIVGDKTGRCDYGTTNDIAVIWPVPERAPLVLVTYFTQPDDKQARARPDVLAAAAHIMTQIF
ncbi:class A beta-lactamase [Xenorhabdus sp. IM139775]|uniref:class A beta-lactamase n=1 Tax=Xenorhabdus sp. IM139775 TaxID=3025876 RepID=UPI002359E636|nr:class A beta-lactamase [Xenorhabdus sp. IM139775]MDC9592385.1 class A beta-lactamase [Xenorhabdus sp. IM139775]